MRKDFYDFQVHQKGYGKSYYDLKNEIVKLHKEIDKLKRENTNAPVYQCFHCLANSVSWDCDYDFEDFGYDGEGIVQVCHCNSCGADIEYRIKTNI